MEGDLLLLIPAAFNALYAVEWKRLVPGVEARDSLVGLGLLAFWHLVFWVWGFFLLNALGWEVFELCRKMFLVGVLVSFPLAWRAPLAIIMCVAAVAALNAFSPYWPLLYFLLRPQKSFPALVCSKLTPADSAV